MHIPKPVRIRSKKTIDECRKDYCEHCGRKATGEPHHIRPRSLGGSDIPENLIELCGDECHPRAHDGKIPYSVFVVIVAKREKLSVEEVCKRIGWPVPDEITMPIATAPGRTLDELLQQYAVLQESEDDNRWAKGAICLVLTEGMGVSASRVGSWLGCSAAQIRELSKTFKAFPDETRRVPVLTWRHHRIAANSPDPETWIAQASDNDWSTRQMQENVDVSTGKVKTVDLQRAKAEKALLLTKEILDTGGETADWLKTQLLDIVMPVKGASGL